MSQQVLDLRTSMQIVRRHKILVGLAVILGLGLGVAYTVLNPPLLTSTALVVLPNATQPTGGGADSYMDTQVVIATSSGVLSSALPNIHPAMSLGKLHSEVQAGSPTTYIVSISAKGKTATAAEATTNAVAESYIALVTGPNSPVGRIPARLLVPATSAAGTGPIESLIITGLIGAVVGAAIGVIVVLAFSRRDKRLRARDQIANSIGVPVLASIPVAHPSDASGWTKLLQDYKPGPVYAWRLRKAFQQLEISDDVLRSASGGGNSSLLVLSLSSDRGALALGPQLAVFAASLGIPTALVIGPQQDANATAALRTACATVPPSAPGQEPRYLHVAVCEGSDFERPPGTVLTVVVGNVDGRTPQVPDTVRTTTTFLGVSAGSVTAEQLARVAVSAAISGREITGILVADPESADDTTGQTSQVIRPMRRRLPTRLTGYTTEIKL